MLPMMVGLIGTSIWSGLRMSKTGKYKSFPIMGSVLTIIAMLWMTSLSAATPIWVICAQLFLFGAGLGFIMQIVVIVVQNSVPPAQLGTATSTNNYFREVGSALGVAVFGAMFTTRLADSLRDVFTGAGASLEQAGNSMATLDPQALAQLPPVVKDGIINAYADSLAPVFWYLIPFMVVALVLAIFMKVIPLSDTSGMVARGEAIGGEEAVRLEAERAAAAAGTGAGTGAGTARTSQQTTGTGTLLLTKEEPAPLQETKDKP